MQARKYTRDIYDRPNVCTHIHTQSVYHNDYTHQQNDAQIIWRQANDVTPIGSHVNDVTSQWRQTNDVVQG